MVELVHEIWEEKDDKVAGHMLCLSGPEGDPHRKLNSPSAVLIHTFKAQSYFEARSIFNRYFDYGPWIPEPDWEDVVYTEEQAKRQRKG